MGAPGSGRKRFERELERLVRRGAQLELPYFDVTVRPATHGGDALPRDGFSRSRITLGRSRSEFAGAPRTSAGSRSILSAPRRPPELHDRTPGETPHTHRGTVVRPIGHSVTISETICVKAPR